MSQQVVRDFRENELLRHGFDALAQQVFGISFEAWYRQGYWTDRYRPYLLVQDDLPVACAAANLQDLWWDGRVRRCIQIGTVMTAPAARGQGFARQLIKEILQDWETAAELIFLFANPAATTFYEALGFMRQPEYRWLSPALPGGRREAVPLDLSRADDRSLLWFHTLEGNPFSALTLHRGYELLLFHLMQNPALQVVFLPRADTVAVLQQQSDQLCCLELFGGRGTLAQVLGQLGHTGPLALGFTPLEPDGFLAQKAADTDPLLVLPRDELPPFAVRQLCLSPLSHC